MSLLHSPAMTPVISPETRAITNCPQRDSIKTMCPNTLFQRTITLRINAESDSPALAGADLSSIRDDAYERFQDAFVDLARSGYTSGTLTQHIGAKELPDRIQSGDTATIQINWTLSVEDHPQGYIGFAVAQ